MCFYRQIMDRVCRNDLVTADEFDMLMCSGVARDYFMIVSEAATTDYIHY